MKFDINLVSKKARRPVLVVAASLDGIAEACKNNNIKVLVYKLDSGSKNTCANNYYLGLDNFYANEKLRENQLSAATIRSHVERMIKARSQIRTSEVSISDDAALTDALKLDQKAAPLVKEEPTASE